MLFSVIIPAYNCEKSLASTVESIMLSGLVDFEVIIINDGSTDGTAQKCRALEERYSDVICFNRQNSGVSETRNIGVEKASGEYILFVDSDDSVDSGSFDHAVEIISEYHPDMLIFGLSFDYYYKDRLYRRDEMVYGREGMFTVIDLHPCFKELFDANALSPVWNKFIRRSVITKNGIHFKADIIEMEDFLYSTECLSHCRSVYLLPKAIYRYRQTENEKSTFNRLMRIKNLSEYMRPFTEILSCFSADASDCDSRVITRLDEVIYSNFLNEIIRFGTVKQIKKAAEDMLSGEYCDDISSVSPELWNMLKSGNYPVIYLRSLILGLKHRLAVRVKYFLSKWRRK